MNNGYHEYQMYSAQRSAGAPKENAQEGASVLGEPVKEIIQLKSGQRLIQWMVSLNIMLTMLVIGFLLTQ